MKIRTDFVTNSSSSSFTLLIRLDIKGKKPIQYKTTSGVGEGFEKYYELVATKGPEELGDADSIDELITMLKESIGQDGLYGHGPEDPENRVLTDDTPFIKQIRMLSSMDEITKITITGNLDGRDAYWHRTYTYDMSTGEMKEEVDGEDFDSEGTGGGLEFRAASRYRYYENIGGHVFFGSKKEIEDQNRAHQKEYEEYKRKIREYLQSSFEEYVKQTGNGFKHEKYLAGDIDVEFTGKKFTVDNLTFGPEIRNEIELHGGTVFKSFGKTSDYYIVKLGRWIENFHLLDAVQCVKNGSNMKIITEYQFWKALWKVRKPAENIQEPENKIAKKRRSAVAPKLCEKELEEGSDGLKQADIHRIEQTCNNGSWRDNYTQCAQVEMEPEDTRTPATDFIYVNNGEEVQINGYKGLGGLVSIPDRIEGNPVTRIAAQAFFKNITITGLILPKDLHYIGSMAFADNSNLTGILIIPQNVVMVESHSFWCTNLTEIVIQSNCKIDVNAFANLKALKSVFIKKGCSPKFGTAVIGYSSVFTVFIVPEEVQEMKNENFTACNLLTIYTPAGSYAADYARRNFIRCNTEDYEKVYAEYETRYSELPKEDQEKLEKNEEEPQEVFSDDLPEESAELEQQYGEDIWHPVEETNYEFRIFGFIGNGSPVIVQVRDKETMKIIGTVTKTVDFSSVAPEDEYEITTNYEVDEIKALSPDCFTFNWYAAIIQEEVELFETYAELTVDLGPDDEEEQEIDLFENEGAETGEKEAVEETEEEKSIPDTEKNWICPDCGKTISSRFCPDCGTVSPLSGIKTTEATTSNQIDENSLKAGLHFDGVYCRLYKSYSSFYFNKAIRFYQNGTVIIEMFTQGTQSIAEYPSSEQIDREQPAPTAIISSYTLVADHISFVEKVANNTTTYMGTVKNNCLLLSEHNDRMKQLDIENAEYLYHSFDEIDKSKATAWREC